MLNRMKLIFDEIGYRSEIKLAILHEYATVYSLIMTTIALGKRSSL